MKYLSKDYNIFMNVSNIKNAFSYVVQNVLIITTFWKMIPNVECADFNK